MSPSLFLPLINVCWVFVVIPRRRVLPCGTGRRAQRWDGSVLFTSKKETVTCQCHPGHTQGTDRRPPAHSHGRGGDALLPGAQASSSSSSSSGCLASPPAAQMAQHMGSLPSHSHFVSRFCQV